MILSDYMQKMVDKREYEKRRIQEHKEKRQQYLKNGIFDNLYNAAQCKDLNPIRVGESQQGSRCICGKTDIGTTNYLFDKDITVYIPYKNKYFTGKSFRLGDQCFFNHIAFIENEEINERKTVLDNIKSKTKKGILKNE
jgi:hypothetical protein